MRITAGRTIPAAAALAAALLLAGPVRADAARDAQIREAAADAVLGYAYYGVFDSVDLGVDKGVVVLRGSVRHPWRKEEIERRVARVDGVREVRSELRVQPLSSGDDRLRATLYRRIYGDVLPRFAGTPNPPVHIVVENGDITLTGLVNSRVEKAQLEAIARSTLSFRVDNQVRVENVG